MIASLQDLPYPQTTHPSSESLDMFPGSFDIYRGIFNIQNLSVPGQSVSFELCHYTYPP